MKISINIPFWYSNQDRLDNLNLTYQSLLKLRDYLVSKGLEIEVNVFEFSNDKQWFEHSIFIPIGIEYGKSLKLNKALKFINEGIKPDIVSFFDSDCFIDIEEYDRVYKLLTTFDKSKYYCNNLTKLASRYYINKETLVLDKTFISFYNSGIINGLGGIWFCDFQELISIGGFDESYVGWGKEDEDVGKRLYMKGLLFEQLPFKVYHLPHTEEISKTNILLREQQENKFVNDSTIIRATLLNNYIV